MTEAEVLDLINSFIVANGNNEITANVLRPILVAMLEQPNDKVGELSALSTTDKSNIVNAINEVLSEANSGFEIHAGTADPNVTPPATYAIGDWYIRNGVSLYQYNGSTWVLQTDTIITTTTTAESFVYDGSTNSFTVINPIVEIIDVQIEYACNFDNRATIDTGTNVTIFPFDDILFGGERVKIIYTY